MCYLEQNTEWRYGIREIMKIRGFSEALQGYFDANYINTQTTACIATVSKEHMPSAWNRVVKKLSSRAFRCVQIFNYFQPRKYMWALWFRYALSLCKYLQSFAMFCALKKMCKLKLLMNKLLYVNALINAYRNKNSMNCFWSLFL